MDRVDYQSMIVQDLINDNRDQKLNLSPWYQRRSVWNKQQKAYLINTLFERKPIPALYVRHSIDIERGISIKEVVDGQQRARSIIEFCNNEYSARIESGGTRKTFSQLTRAEKESFLTIALPTGFLIGASDADVIDIFARINSISKTLNPQEKRNAKFSGEFKQFCLSESVKRLNFWRRTNIFSANDIARMVEVLFISDLIYNLEHGISDFRPKAIDDIYKDNDDNYANADLIADKLENIFGIFYDIPVDIFVDTIFNRPPLLFSLCIIVDDIQPTADALREAMLAVDAEFRDEDINAGEVVAFRDAVSASTQRISSRNVRDQYIRSKF